MKRWMTVWDFSHPLTYQWFGALVTSGVISQGEYRLWVIELFLVHFMKIMMSTRFQLTVSMLKHLHWLPVRFRNIFKITYCF